MAEVPMSMSASEIHKRIKAALPDAQVELRDLAGDDNHWAATITSEQFRGKSRVQQHQLVNAAFGADMGTTLHSLAIQTAVPE
jgi:stress-induced morphogen